eukprot:11240617-Heterocapsa_arctica.AAC.1
MDGRRFGTNLGRIPTEGLSRSPSTKSRPQRRSPEGSFKPWPWLSDQTRPRVSMVGQSRS